MNPATIDKINRMIEAAERWLEAHDYHHRECNDVPPRLFTRHRKLNMLIRTVFRLLPFNLRSKKDIAQSPYTPHEAVASLTACGAGGDAATGTRLTRRVLEQLRSPLTSNFALRQGIRISISLYEDSADDPTPLNTVFFGNYLLDHAPADDATRREVLVSICRYLTQELGYEDYGTEGVYFFYGHHLKDVIYNASALISSFLIRTGTALNLDEYVELGRRGIRFIINNQNPDGSWYYCAPPHRKAIDGFHQSYILKALIDVRDAAVDGLAECINKGAEFYRSQFTETGAYLIPQRYDKRFNPGNTWLFQRLDGRDLSEAISFYSMYLPDEERVEKLVNYMHDRVFSPRSGKLAPEIFVYGKNHNEYIEFYAWYLHALYCARNTFAAK